MLTTHVNRFNNGRNSSSHNSGFRGGREAQQAQVKEDGPRLQLLSNGAAEPLALTVATGGSSVEACMELWLSQLTADVL